MTAVDIPVFAVSMRGVIIAVNNQVATENIAVIAVNMAGIGVNSQ